MSRPAIAVESSRTIRWRSLGRYTVEEQDTCGARSAPRAGTAPSRSVRSCSSLHRRVSRPRSAAIQHAKGYARSAFGRNGRVGPRPSSALEKSLQASSVSRSRNGFRRIGNASPNHISRSRLTSRRVNDDVKRKVHLQPPRIPPLSQPLRALQPKDATAPSPEQIGLFRRHDEWSVDGHAEQSDRTSAQPPATPTRPTHLSTSKLTFLRDRAVQTDACAGCNTGWSEPSASPWLSMRTRHPPSRVPRYGPSHNSTHR